MARHPVALRALGVLDPRWAPERIHAADSVFTEADPRPGTAATLDPLARLVPQIVGAQSRPVSLLVTRSGMPARGDAVWGNTREESGAARVAYYLEGETAADARHLEPPVRPSGWTSPGLAASQIADAVFCPLSGKILAKWAGALAGCWNPHTGAWEDVATTGVAVAAGALVALPGTDRVLSIGSSAVYWTDDYGATWEQLSGSGPGDAAADSPVPVYSGKMRAAVDGAGSLLWLGLDANDSSADFMASSDLGASWTEIRSSVLQDADIAAGPDGGIYVAWVQATTGFAYVSRLGSAWDDFAAATPVEIHSGGTYSRVWVAVMPSGLVWVYLADATSPWRVTAWYSDDLGVTWTGARGTGQILAYGDATAVPGGVRAVPNAYGGASLAWPLVSGTVGAGAVGLLNLGGWAGPSMGVSGNTINAARHFGVAADSGVWWGWGRPDDFTLQWTPVGAGARALVSGGGLELASGGGGAEASYTQTLSCTSPLGYVEIQADVPDDGGSSSGAGVHVTARQGGAELSVVLYLTETGYRVFDLTAAAWMGAEVALDLLTAPARIRIRVTASGVKTAHARWGTAWTVTSWGAPTAGASGATQLVVRWGTFAVVGVTSRWYHVSATSESWGDFTEGVDGLGASCDEVGGVLIPNAHDTAAERLSLLRLRGGPGVAGEVYEHDVAPGYPIEALFPQREPSRQRTWRTVDKSADADVVVDLGRDTRPHGAHSVAVVVRANVRRVRIATKEDGGGAYTTIGTVDLAEGFTTLEFARTGEVLSPAGSPTGTRHVAANELRGGHVVLDPAGTPVLRKIRGNTGGPWNAAAGVPLRIWLDGVDDTEPLSGSLHIVWPAGVLVLHGDGSAASLARYWRLRVASTELAVEDYYEVATAAPMGLVVPGKRWGDGAEWTLSPHVRVDEDPSGTQRRTQLGGNRRALTLTWDHGAKMDRVRGQTADYLATATGPGLAVRDDVWGQLSGIWDLTEGTSLPVLWLGSDPGDGTTLTDPTLWMLGYIEGDLRVTISEGDEGDDEFVRAGPVRIVEAL